MGLGNRNVAALMVGRCIAGFAVGVLSMIVPLYQVSISLIHCLHRQLLTDPTRFAG